MLEIKLESNWHSYLKTFIDELVQLTNSKIEKKEWISKYNSYVVYDYEPFCSDGFVVRISIEGTKESLGFIKYEYDKRIEQINRLNNALLEIGDKQNSPELNKNNSKGN